MSITGKNSIHFTKKDLQDQKVPAIGFKKIKFAHEATAGDTVIDLSALNLPSSGIPASFVNPSASDISAAKLLFNSKNIQLVSSLSGLLEFDSYEVVSNTAIKLKNPAAAGELFMGTVDPVAKTGLQVMDNDPVVATGVVAASADEFIVGKPFDLNKYPTTQQGSILVFLDGQLMARNVGNQQNNAGDGDYWEVEVTGSQVGNSIKFNTTSLTERSVMVVSNGLMAAAPTDSVISQVENLSGQVDALVPTVAALAGVAETEFQAAPNNVDLKAFGDRMVAVEVKNRWQKKYLVAAETATVTDIATNGTAGNEDFHFTGLTIGNQYRLHMNARLDAGSGGSTGDSTTLVAVHDGNNIVKLVTRKSGTGANRIIAGQSTVFTATATSVTFDFSESGIAANSVQPDDGTFIVIEELINYDVESSDF